MNQKRDIIKPGVNIPIPSHRYSYVVDDFKKYVEKRGRGKIIDTHEMDIPFRVNREAYLLDAIGRMIGQDEPKANHWLPLPSTQRREEIKYRKRGEDEIKNRKKRPPPLVEREPPLKKKKTEELEPEIMDELLDLVKEDPKREEPDPPREEEERKEEPLKKKKKQDPRKQGSMVATIVKEEDFRILRRSMAKLNDEIVNSFLYTLEKEFPENLFFNSFFYTLFKEGFDRVKKSIPKNFFEFEKVFIPINRNKNHWVVMVIDNLKKEIHYYDSLYSDPFNLWKDMDTLLVEVREDFGMRADHYIKKDMKTNVPQQKDNFNCGVYMLKYIQAIVKGQPIKLSIGSMPLYRTEIRKKIAENQNIPDTLKYIERDNIERDNIERKKSFDEEEEYGTIPKPVKESAPVVKLVKPRSALEQRKRVYVAKPSTDGWGLFAHKNIEKGEVLTYYDGAITEKPKNFKMDQKSSHFMSVPESYLLFDGKWVTNKMTISYYEGLAAYANSSKTHSNAEFIKFNLLNGASQSQKLASKEKRFDYFSGEYDEEYKKWVGENQKHPFAVLLVAKKTIKQNDEILVDYRI